MSVVSEYKIEKSKLEGNVRISGAKNSVLRLMAASLLTADPVILENYPSTLLDARVHADMLEALGKTCVVEGDCLTISELATLSSDLNWGGRSIRNTLLILGALVARTGYGAVPLPGGCSIGDSAAGDRAYDLHVMLLETLGARVFEREGMLVAEAPLGLTGGDVHLRVRSTGATENALICGALARGVTRIYNPHLRVEILDLIKFLKSMGAVIRVYGQECIEIDGVAGSLSGVRHRVMPDNMEALTWVIGSVMTGGDIHIYDFPAADLEVPLIFLRESGARIYTGPEGSVIVRGGACYPLDVTTGPYPGINSDMQPIMAAYGARARGETKIVDLRFPGRYGYAREFALMGVKAQQDGNMLCVSSGQSLIGTEVTALDLRAGVALSLLGMCADGQTTIREAWQVERGYDRFVEKVVQLGGRIKAT
ncbi:UDP-N-acetylglucosamine 1-carboxyvinyltransferase (plasmid) [Agrobacterium sp. MA01]|uniref:UDP-N-acetylglucosamine 1-carboxyvinyltransferase n=1 Tax=Agrobacterium sp. MA01 TaxID=2664893 RepID=UPI00129B119E|nr:UDP-N-acetylglucosamine 1-carboxyvinyltransferase [Agrobacterium sp. MA01]QGG93585.1 UDP-N-acetylglucosamine 1-carboxyvinyltransferase [Agrobacterium sp. MA01]